MPKNKLFPLMFSLIFLFIFSTACTGEVKELWNYININHTAIDSIELKAKEIWKEFETGSTQRGMIIKPNYQPFVPTVNRIIMLDNPMGELAYRDYRLRVETEVINGKDARIAELTLSKISRTEFPEAVMEQQIGYANGRLGENITYWVKQKKIIPEELKAFEQLKLENFKRSIELEYTGGLDYRRVPTEDVFFFFPEISDGLKLSFDYLYPQNDTPMLRTTYEPGRIRFGSVLNSDVRISFLHDMITGKMLHGEISWKITFGEFTTGEEVGLCESFFHFMQENLAKAGLIAPAVPAPFY